MFKDEYQAVCGAAAGKLRLLKDNPAGYFLSAMLAGMFISFGSFVAFTLGAYVNSGLPALTKAAQSFAFAAALSLVVMAGAELFTGNNFVLGAGILRKTCTLAEAGKLWGICWLGNLAGSWLAVLLFQLSGVPSGDVGAYFSSLAAGKAALAPAALLARSILCNILVCLAVWCGIKMKSESGKLIMIFWCIFVFMVCGFEHSVANMSTIAVGMLGGSVSFGGYLYNILLATLGNLIGGVFFVAWPYERISRAS